MLFRRKASGQQRSVMNGIDGHFALIFSMDMRHMMFFNITKNIRINTP